ncbi:hypothetical protein BV25DRAFT_1813665 [Artomyces pyxidatus]|uniref:Uncharacterized protein n=1 Tax=Artomyces pyxidatus TaxID=48021 RepID=A0ACB8SJP0_9AGAM|nr:hypothetical protein BV25DRAFT_1813665 [Artomyces pyxidatus]
MPLPQHDWDHHLDNPFVAEQLDYDRERERALALNMVSFLNTEQLAAYQCIVASVEEQDGKMFFLHGPGGTGKTYLYKTLCHKIRGGGGITLCVASSGIAALLLPGGRTSHSMFQIPVDGLTHTSSCSINKEGQRADMLRQVRLIIWDEVVMQHR